MRRFRKLQYGKFSVIKDLTISVATATTELSRYWYYCAALAEFVHQLLIARCVSIRLPALVFCSYKQLLWTEHLSTYLRAVKHRKTEAISTKIRKEFFM